MAKFRYYFDHNASHPMVDEAKKSLLDTLDIYGNPSSVHFEGRKAKSILELSRTNIANLLNINPHNLVFTSGASEAAATLLTPHYVIGKSNVTMSNLYMSSIEHQCIISGGKFLPEQISKIAVTQSGLVSLENLDLLLSKHDYSLGYPLVAIQAVNSETGVIQPIKAAADIVHEYKGIIIVDAVQFLGKVDTTLIDNCADFYLISGHKIGAAKNIGAFICNSDIIAPESLIKGKQEKGRRGGTQSISLISSFEAALKKRLDLIANTDYLLNLQKLRDYFEYKLLQIDSNAVIYGKNAPRISNTSFFSLSTIDAQTLQMALDINGFALSAGSACSSGTVSHSYVLQAMGYGDNISAIRFSIGTDNNIEQVDCLLDSIKLISER